ncbi:Putative AAA+ ATPase domain, ABC transporter type 1, transmembrane domain-containing protein [Septoria linicola]|uniref:AAA+ ATPase domain, ABC transporter type 1, transmembrane domain-containing protein n=1 Tax=Septoria linicola TaxID=215465 RepID=A0A9Q9ENI4_9PEZI|nr:Putative AAA+ ATPase domain, ABC transporter type 1, transmembrane domain-containing protein [Septoria linicola]
MSAPDAEKALTSNTVEAPGPQEPRQTEALAEEPLDRVGSESELNEEKQIDYEAVETSSQDDSDFEKKKRPQVARARSDWTTATENSVATEIEQPAQKPPRKRKWSEKINPFKSKHPVPVPKERIASREQAAGFFSVLTFQWISPLMSVGYQRSLELNDIWHVNSERSVDVMRNKLLTSLEYRKGRKDWFQPLPMALYDTFKREFWIGGITNLVAACLQVLSPFTMKYLIAFAGKAYAAQQGLQPAPHIGEGIGLVFGITCMQIIQSSCINHFIYRGMMVGGQARSTLISVIFAKAMRLSGRAKAGGAALGAEDEKPKFEPGSKEEKAYFKKKLKEDKKQKSKKGVSGDGQGWGNGRIVNLMSVDTYRIDQACGMGHMVWTAPIQILLTLALLCINLTYSALAGFAFICLMMPLLGRAIRSLMARRKVINKITDQRVSLTQEIIQSVRFVKYFGWEMSFISRLGEIRDREISKVSFLLSIRNGIMAVSMSIPIFASMLAFITYSTTQHNLNPAPVFSSLALFNALRIPLNLLPMVLGQVVDANASLNRIAEFLAAEEVNDDSRWDEDAKHAIEIKQGGFTWERNTNKDEKQAPGADPKGRKQIAQEKKDAKAKAKSDKQQSKLDEKHQSSTPAGSASPAESVLELEKPPFQINNVDLTVGRDELIAVIGSVGSGKSSLLAALAGDMRKTEGDVTFGANRAFCPQYAWIQNATVKENIIFGKDYNRKWYNEVIDACALRPDLEMLPAGDLTEIGERGITVSGGQKQRLNIARAIYFDADIVLMDDPLSAVDAHVGKHIMDNAICGLLRGKARVLATHQLHVLHRVDRIVWMKDGAIYKIATFPDLMEHDAEFQKLMETTAQEEKKEDEDEANEDEIEEEKKDAKKKKGKKPAAALMQQEERAVDSVGWGVYAAYVRASGGMWVAPFVLFLLVISQGANIMTSLWLSYWTAGRWGLGLGVYIGVYAALGVSQACLMFAFSVVLTIYGTRSSKVMLNRAVTRVLRAPMSFFDTTPLGRITNRFSKDVDTMDNTLTDSMRMFFLTMCMILSVFILIIAYYYYFAIALVPLTIMFIFSASYYRSSARELKRHEAVLRSVVFARFSEAVNGTSTIRAYGVQRQFANHVDESVDSMDGAYFLTFANQRWLSTRLDALGNLLVFTVGILVVTSRFSINPSTGGLVLSYILSIVQMIQFTVRQLAEVENNMNSTERIHYYGTELEEEAPLHLGEVPGSWPEKGAIDFDNVQMRYRDGLPLVLKGLTMHVRAGERIGVVGRTGAGKSTIMSTLFRLVELSGGSISIDGVNIAKIGLHDLRSRLAIIPQDPTLFRGTIRSNLDPFNEHTDLELWNALRQADLVGAEQTIEDEGGRIHLDTAVEDEGLNFSLGQRQLLALARALVRGSQIIVCDEATSSVDFETDQKIQRTIVRGFKGKTLLCIAHRLKTIIGYDRILVMDQGNVAELDRPITLYDQGGIFRSMCDRSGIRREDFFTSEEARFSAESPELERTQSAVMKRQ